MSNLNNADYYRARIAETDRLARAARDEHIRDIHLDMGRRYRALLDESPLDWPVDHPIAI